MSETHIPGISTSCLDFRNGLKNVLKGYCTFLFCRNEVIFPFLKLPPPHPQQVAFYDQDLDVAPP